MSRKYKFELKRNAVEHYLNTNDSFKVTAKKYQVSISLLKEWVARAREQGIESLNSKCTRYDIQFKMKVLNFMNNTGASPLQAAAMFNVPSPRTVRKWRSMLESQGIDALRKTSKGYSTVKKKRAIAPKKKQNINSQNGLQKEIEYLRMENAYFKKVTRLNSRNSKITEKDKAYIIYELRHEYKIMDLIKVARMARSTYYYWVKQMNREDKYRDVKESIKQIFNEHQGRYGYRRITLELRNRGYAINHKTVLRLMNQLGIKSLVRIAKYRSYRGKVGKIAPNVLKRDFKAFKPNEKWVTDVTEVHLFGEKLYLSPILDLFNGEIISYNIEKRPTFLLVERMLDEALKCLNKGDTPILHSDQGWHYQMDKYQHILKEHNIIQSMSRKGNCLDNAVIENFFGLLKSELLYLQEFESMEHFKRELENYIHYYNHKRIKTKLKGLSPVKYRIQSLLVA
ncbi:IS3 family transposase [Bacillus wiedmannii]|uniref:IS3 family transposase n=1 Tax=Bacillus wiedmannii TaxID=1890302 RepID=UPI000BF669E0|nr:IS3 family transposase [Bacillus wiedmannii]PFZ44508.1 IS3 family transposase [Bacillus wiedmannii]PGA87058.1 IS3 family transposase [Bacillus wiedmannii]